MPWRPFNISPQTRYACKKLQHKSLSAAKAHVLGLLAKNELLGDAKKGALIIYICKFCGYYHVGHIRPSKTQDE
jgi:hypothetical protein